MELKRLLHDDDAVSPVIGVILMVAITVILAAVIASFVLGLGGNQQATPTASFTFDFTQDESNSFLQITHDGGDTIKASELYLRGDGFGSEDATDYSRVDASNAWETSDETWLKSETSTEKGDESAVAAGDSLVTSAETDYEIRIVWQPGSGDTSSTLGQDTGPDA